MIRDDYDDGRKDRAVLEESCARERPFDVSMIEAWTLEVDSQPARPSPVALFEARVPFLPSAY